MYSIDSKRSKNMLYDIIGWVYGIWAIAFFVYAVIWNIRWLCFKGKCSNTIQCRRRDCWFSCYCDKQVEVLTEEEIQLVQEWIERLKSQKKTA
jgi:hypothetical protein